MAIRPNEVLSAAEASRIWSLYDLKNPGELVLEDIALALGIVVVDGRLDSCIARLLRNGSQGLVRISDKIMEPGRRRFAIAHEIGHWLLHEKVSHLLACTDADMLQSYKASPLEVEASIFAGNLLMPEHLFIPASSNRNPTTSLIKNLATKFGTTLTATAVRYVETSDDYCVLVVSEQNKIKWWRASRRFGDYEFWLDTKTTLPRHSVAANFYRREPVPERPQTVSFRDWFGEIPGIYSETVLEQAIPLASYGQVLSLIWLP
jgi:hypothetical protein